MKPYFEKSISELTYEDKKHMLDDFASAILDLRHISKFENLDLFLFHAQTLIETFCIVLLQDESKNEEDLLIDSVIDLPKA
jgi:hypothetical protein